MYAPYHIQQHSFNNFGILNARATLLLRKKKVLKILTKGPGRKQLSFNAFCYLSLAAQDWMCVRGIEHDRTCSQRFKRTHGCNEISSIVRELLRESTSSGTPCGGKMTGITPKTNQTMRKSITQMIPMPREKPRRMDARDSQLLQARTHYAATNAVG
jgi:hypothetical protein